ncbi:conserved Plasmodium protein, unknown function [Plasmodium knowlesi strain H]|uniref:Uncharacterized protein n=3 Tax=Plasmodium knowlesi TaxID=5850 RepID=A0A5E7WX13_PLAKH|nr:conserved Plasmodium protein, unknown function [Plasmodium knowlesi strain H]OTN68218.1 Uncharacterized protein PKNOH_S03325300 [Plasmodium knowlesi]CAA9987156.1 conserved Plasmodium protein, unknown function [Plasmodium knowlesi strain H]SBO23911.1 conserved Plasmodium protein, unknown function [Plasmodium knowlesi strain H]SBO25791.1 conserved Plasmodium protein, unknown function [Plasmodium knowlesi strain H]VVS76630.1 conserved Plasmodium protein, unknown function [Plasmodium knowlesi s
MNAQTLKESDMNEMILGLMKNKKRGTVARKKKTKRKPPKGSLTKEEIKSNAETAFKRQEQMYRDEEAHTLQYIRGEVASKEKELNDYYVYCQRFKNEYKTNFNEALKQSEEMRKELSNLRTEYLDLKLLLEDQRKMELNGMFNFYKKKLLDIKAHCISQTFCDENLKNIVHEILRVIH